jgi:hypothetical protein
VGRRLLPSAGQPRGAKEPGPFPTRARDPTRPGRAAGPGTLPGGHSAPGASL